MPALRRHAPLVGLAIVLAFAALLVWRFEWWPAVPIAILSTGVVLATRWPVDQRRLRLGALAIGASSALGRDPLVHGLGLVSLIALAPILSVMLLGLLVRLKERKEP